MFSTRSITGVAWMIASIFYAYQYILRVMPNIMMNDILQQFHIDAGTFGQFSGVYYIGYSLMHLPIGLMLDRYGPKKVMPVCILMTVAGLLPLIFAEFWVYPLIGRLLIGIGSSAAILGTFKVIRLVFAEEKFTRMLSLSVTIGLIGAIYGGGPVNAMCQSLGHKAVLMIFAGIGIVLSLITYALVPETQSPQQETSVFSKIKEVLSNPKVLFTCFLSGLLVGPLEGFADVWGSEFLKKVYSFEGALAASLPSAIFIGMCFGAPVLSWIAEKTDSYFGAIIASGALMGLSFMALLMFTLPAPIMSVMFIIVGVCSAYQIIAIYKASTYVDEKVVGLTTAVANMIIMIFGYLFHSVIGWTINTLGGTANPTAFLYGIAVIPAALLIGTLGFIALAAKE